jgi:hypothetical protein
MQNNRRLQLIQVSRNKQVAGMLWIAAVIGWLVALGIFLMKARKSHQFF